LQEEEAVEEEVHGIKFACVGVSVVCNAVLRLTISCCIPEIFAIKSRCPKSRRNSMFFGRQISVKGVRGRKWLTEFHKSGSLLIMWQSLATIAQATSGRLGGEKNKEDGNMSSKTERLVLTIYRQ